MRKITLIENISLDGIIQAPGSPSEDGDYEYGGWTVPYFNSTVSEAIDAAQGESFDLLIGRRTYDIFAGYWPGVTDSAMADRLNGATKYVATHRPDSLSWGPAKGVGPNIEHDIAKIKSNDGPDLIVWGSSSLTSLLIEKGLADEVLLLVYPILLGDGKRIFAPGAGPRQLALLHTKTTSTGVVISTYRPLGLLRTESSVVLDKKVGLTRATRKRIRKGLSEADAQVRRSRSRKIPCAQREPEPRIRRTRDLHHH